jgi:hypothetical protein
MEICFYREFFSLFFGELNILLKQGVTPNEIITITSCPEFHLRFKTERSHHVVPPRVQNGTITSCPEFHLGFKMERKQKE